MSNNALIVLEELEALIRERHNADAGASYTAKLLRGDEDALLKKLVEEAGETVLAAKGGDNRRLIAELADLWFHCLIIMSRYNVSLADVASCLRARRGVSGIDEKKSRGEH